MGSQIKYLKANSIEEAVALLDMYSGKIKIFAGGTDLMVQMYHESKKLDSAKYFLDIHGIEELKGISQDGENISVGALSTHSQLAESDIVQAAASFLAAASLTVGSPQIRNTGTIGGNIFNGSLAADTLSVLLALDASVELKCLDSNRITSVESLFSCPDRAIKPGEIAVRFIFKRIDGYKNIFLKLGRRKSLAISRLNVAMAMKINGNKMEDVRIVTGCIFPKPSRLPAMEGALNGQAVSRELFEDCSRLICPIVLKETGMRWSTNYKLPALKNMVYSVMCKCSGIEEKWEEVLDEPWNDCEWTQGTR